MGHKKLIKFEAIRTFPNVFEHDVTKKGKWHEYFGNNNPIVLELACGKGEYTVAMSKAYPDKNFIGIDIKGNRMFRGAKICLEEKRTNAAFLRIQIDKITDFFESNEVSEIWIIFPDPFLRDSRAKNRLTSPKFLSKYKHVLQPEGFIHLKTDSKELFTFTEETVTEQGCPIAAINRNIYAQGEPSFPLNVKTFYEQMHLADNRTIQFIQFQLPKHDIKLPPKKSQIEQEHNTTGNS